MIGEEIKDVLKEISVDQLRALTWDYASNDVVGLFNDKIIRGYLFEVKEGGEVNPLVITRCNVAEGWVECIECDEPIPAYPAAPNPLLVNIKCGEDGEIIKTKVNCKVVVDIFDVEGNVIVTLR